MSPFFDSSGEALEIFGEDFLIFTLAGARYGVAYAKVEETRTYETQGVMPVAVPLPSLLGKAYVSGVDVPVIDLRQRLDPTSMPPAASGVILFVRLHGHRAGLLVDTTEGVTIVQQDELEPAVISGSPAVPAAALLGEKTAPGRHAWLIDVEKLLSSDEIARACEVVDAERAEEKQFV